MGKRLLARVLPMLSAIRLSVLLALFVAGAAFSAPSGASAAPETMETLNVQGLQKLIQANKGKPVLLNFFATWCPPCQAEIPVLVSMDEKYRGKVLFVGLTVDDNSTIGKVPALMTRMKARYPVYRVSSDVIQAFGIGSIPFNVGYSAQGKMAWAYSGILDEENFEQMLKDLLK